LNNAPLSADIMIDILVYLFENYLPDACPEPEVLARKLSAAGFGSDDISEALSWLDGLAGRKPRPAAPGTARRDQNLRRGRTGTLAGRLSRLHHLPRTA
jgi:uncharacterized protein Smg (DUF494 family)